MNVGKSGTAHTRGEPLQALFIDVKSVQTTGRLHQCTESQCLASCAGTEVTHHFAALGAHKTRNELTALVLNVDSAFLIDRPANQTGLIRQANTVGRELHEFSRYLVFGKFRNDVFSLSLQRIDAQIKRSCLKRSFKKLRCGFAVLLAFEFVQPERHLGTDFGRSLFELQGKHIGHRPFFGTENLIAHALDTVLHRQRQERSHLGSALGLDGLHAPGNFGIVPQRIENGFGQNRSITATQLRVGLEERLHERISRSIELKNHRKSARQLTRDQIGDADFARIEFLLTHCSRNAFDGSSLAILLSLTLLRSALTFRKLLFRFFSTDLNRRKRHLFGFLFHGCVSQAQQSKTARDLAVSSSVTVRPSTSLTLPEATALTARG